MNDPKPPVGPARATAGGQPSADSSPLERAPGRRIWQLAWPVMLTHALFTALHIIDMFWVGRLGASAVAATALASSVISVLFSGGQIFTVGALATAARASGSGRADAVRETLRHSLLFALVASLPLAVAGVIFARPILQLFGPEPSVILHGQFYLQVALGTIPLFFCGMITYSIFQAVGDTRTPMYVIAGSNLLNAILDPLLIFGWLGFPRLGVAGAAVATALSMTLGLTVMLLLMRRRGLLVFSGPLNPRLFRTLLSIGLPAGLQGITRPLSGMLIFRIVTVFGTAATAAFGIGLRVLEVMFIYLGGLGVATEVLTGQSLGAKRPDLARRYSGRVALIGLLLQTAVLPILFIFAPAIVRVFTTDPEVVRIGAGYLRIISPMFIIMGLSVGWAGAQRGAGATTLLMVAALVANWAVKLPLAIILARYTGLGTTGIWLGIGISLLVESALHAGGYYSGYWQKRKIEWD